MPTPRINVGAYGKAGDRADVGGTVTRTLQNIDEEVSARKKRNQEAELAKKKGNVLDLQGQKIRTDLNDREREYRKGLNIDPELLGKQTAKFQMDFKEIKSQLPSLYKKQQDGTATEEELAKLYNLENSVNSFQNITKLQQTAVTSLNETLNSTGIDDYSSPEARAKAIALADGTLQLTQVDGMWKYTGKVQIPDGNGGVTEVDVNDNAETFLNDLNLTKKVDWDARSADHIAGYKGNESTFEDALGNKYSRLVYNEQDFIKAATSDLSDPDALDSYAFRYLTSPERGDEALTDAEARERIEDYQLDGYGDFRGTLLKNRINELRRDTEVIQTKQAPAPTPGSGAGTIAGDYQHYGTQIQQGDTSFLDTSIQTALNDPNAFTSLEKSEKGGQSVVKVQSTVKDLSSAKIALAKGKTITLLDGTVVTGATINDYDDEQIAGGVYTVGEYDTNTDVGNSGLFQLYQEGRGFSAKDYGAKIGGISNIQGGLGIQTPKIDPLDPNVINQKVVDVLKEPTKIGTEEALKFREVATTSGGSRGKSTAGKYVKAFTDLTGEVPFFLAGPNGKVSDEFKIVNQNPAQREKVENKISEKLQEYNAIKGTNFTVQDVVDIMKGKKPSSQTPDYKKYQSKK